MFRTLLCPSSGALDCDVDYHIGRIVLGLLYAVCWRLGAVRLADVQAAGSSLSLQTGHHSSLTAPNLQHTANQERYDQCGNQHHSRELLIIGIVMPETC